MLVEGLGEGERGYLEQQQEKRNFPYKRIKSMGENQYTSGKGDGGGASSTVLRIIVS